LRKRIFNDKEFEDNKKEILRRMKATNPNLSAMDKRNSTRNELYGYDNSRIYAWEYEIEEYRKKKRLEMFYKIGAFSGLVSLIITIIDKFKPIKEITYTALTHIFK